MFYGENRWSGRTRGRNHEKMSGGRMALVQGDEYEDRRGAVTTESPRTRRRRMREIPMPQNVGTIHGREPLLFSRLQTPSTPSPNS